MASRLPILFCLFFLSIASCGNNFVPTEEGDSLTAPPDSSSEEGSGVETPGASDDSGKFLDDQAAANEQMIFDGEPLTWLVVGQSNIETGQVAFAFSKEMKKNGLPVLLLDATQGGTRIDCWLPGGNCYQNHVLPYQDVPIDGILYWQGESNALDYSGESWKHYGEDFTALINHYREIYGDVPFVFMELQRYDSALGSSQTASEDAEFEEPLEWQTCREGQHQALQLPDVHMVETQDLTNGELHPIYAYEAIGRRTADVISALYDTSNNRLPLPTLPNEETFIRLSSESKGFGHPVALTNNYAVIGHPQDNSFYYYDSNSLKQVRFPDNTSYFGEALDASGNTIVVGAPHMNNTGAVYVYSISHGAATLKQEISVNGEKLDFGNKLDLSPDGKYLAVAAYFDDEVAENTGAVYVYKREGGHYVFKAKLLPSTGQAHDNFGFGISIANNGTVVVGSCNHAFTGLFAGATYIYELAEERWKEVAIFYGDEEWGFLGDASAINAEGTRAISTAPYKEQGGVAYVYEKEGDQWVQSFRLSSPSAKPFNCRYETGDTTECDYFGYSVGMSDSGDHIFIGAQHDECRGYLYEDDRLVQSYCYDRPENSSLGNRVALSPDGTHMLIGDNSLNEAILVTSDL